MSLNKRPVSAKSFPRSYLYDRPGLEDVVFPDRHPRLHIDRLDEVLAEVRVQLVCEVERCGLGRHEEAIGQGPTFAILELADATGVDGLVLQELEHRVVE